MFLDHGAVDCAQLGASLIEGGTGSKTAKELSHAMDTAGDHSGGEVMRAGDDIGDDLGVLGICDAWFEDADDGRRPIAKDTTIKANGLADDGRIFLESGRPETIGENDDAGGVAYKQSQLLNQLSLQWEDEKAPISLCYMVPEKRLQMAAPIKDFLKKNEIIYKEIEYSI